MIDNSVARRESDLRGAGSFSGAGQMFARSAVIYFGLHFLHSYEKEIIINNKKK